MSIINMLGKLDIFGTEIKWRFKSKENFKSIFGALITLLLAGLFSLKLFIFIDKSYDYGFAKNKINNEFKGNFQYLNMSEWRMILFSDLDSVLDTQDEEINAEFNPHGYMNLSDFINVSFEITTFTDQKQKLMPTETNCAEDTKIELVEVTDNVQNQARYKCFAFQNSSNTLNITRNETLMLKADGNYSKYQLYRMPQFVINLEIKESLVKLISAIDINKDITLFLMFRNYKTNPENFTIEEYYSTFPLKVDLNHKAELDINFKKLSVSKKYELDFYEYEFSNEHKYMILEDSLQSVKSKRNNKNIDEMDYVDTLSFQLMLFEENNQVTFLTLDDVLATLGGFMQIVFAAAQFLAGFYNEKNAERIISKHIMNKYDEYDKTVKNVRSNIDLQCFIMRICIQGERVNAI